MIVYLRFLKNKCYYYVNLDVDNSKLGVEMSDLQ
jgi:hypothetical protein